MLKYIFKIGETTTEVKSLEEIPEGVNYSQQEYELPEEDFIPKAIEIDLSYTSQISRLLRKHIEKFVLEQVPIPQEVINERDRLRAECNQKIIELGVTDFSYRHSQLNL